MVNLSEKIWFNYNSRSQKVRLLIPSLLLMTLLGYTWYTLVQTTFPDGSHYRITWRQYIGLFLFLPVPYLFFKNKRSMVVYLGAYLLLSVTGIAGLTHFHTQYWGLAGVRVPLIQPLPLLLFTVYFFLNATAIFNIELDYKEKKVGPGAKTPL